MVANGTSAILTAGGGIGGAAAGGGIGGLIGSAIAPGPGTALGAAIGALIGGIIGSIGGSVISGLLLEKKLRQLVARQFYGNDPNLSTSSDSLYEAALKQFNATDRTTKEELEENRKTYRLVWHSDKNPSPEATETFKKRESAYQYIVEYRTARGRW